ncbi:hypothetical protein CTI12_AA485700 [Artemisia annua]|uniref:Uncharacterized protein n=1 Tax=Artemisia annua TaxID=35608 RepID=A0A2U1LG34_ARTAN|nr:hypothetical protein CTI12_AA485700 [Artemisia annua]
MSTSSDPLGLLNPSGEKGYKKLADDDEPLYEGSKQSKYQAALAFYNWKIKCNIRDAGFEQLLRFVKSALPGGEKLAGSIVEMKKVLEKLGITYEEVSEEQEEVDDDSDDSSEDGIDHE